MEGELKLKISFILVITSGSLTFIVNFLLYAEDYSPRNSIYLCRVNLCFNVDRCLVMCNASISEIQTRAHMSVCCVTSSPENAAADSPPLVDSPALPDMNVDSSSHDLIPGGARRIESGLLGDKPSSHQSLTIGKVPSIVQKSNENAVSRAIRKANENYQKSQPQSQPDHNRPAPATSVQKPESKVAKGDVDGDDIDVGGDESGEIEIIEGEGRPDLNGDTEVESRKGDESVPNSPKEKALPAHSGGSESSSSSGSSDSDSESSDSGDSRSGTR